MCISRYQKPLVIRKLKKLQAGPYNETLVDRGGEGNPLGHLDSEDEEVLEPRARVWVGSGNTNGRVMEELGKDQWRAVAEFRYCNIMKMVCGYDEWKILEEIRDEGGGVVTILLVGMHKQMDEF